MKYSIGLILGVTFIACGDEPSAKQEVGTKEVTSSTPAKKDPVPVKSSGGQTVSESEYALLEPFLVDLREGIREFSENSVGVCRGQSKNCEEFMGLDAGTLPEGKFMVRADLQAPKLHPEGKWKVDFAVDCEVTKVSKNSTSNTTKSYSKSYEITHVNRTEHGYRLSPLYTITSPSTSGTHNCKWTITGQNLDKPVVWSGSYTIPAK